MLEHRSFGACKNAVVPIIVMLGHLEVDTKILNTDIRTIESDSYREVLGDNRNVNRVLAVIQERARFFCKDK